MGPRSQWAVTRQRSRLPAPHPSAGRTDPENGSRGAGPAAIPLLGPLQPALGCAPGCAPGSGGVSGSGRARARRGVLGLSWRPARPAQPRPAPAGPSSAPPRPQRGWPARLAERRRERLARRLPGRLSARTAPGSTQPSSEAAAWPAGPDASAPGSGSRVGPRRHPGAARHCPLWGPGPTSPRVPEEPGRARRALSRDARRADGARARHAGPRLLLSHREPAGGRGQGRRARGPGRRRPRGRGGRRRRPGGRGRRAGAAAAAAAAETAARGLRARRGGAGAGAARAWRAGPRSPAAPRARAALRSGLRRRDTLVLAGARRLRRRPQS